MQAESQRTVACRPVLSHRTHQRIKSSQAAHTVGNASPLITCPRLTNHAGIHPFEFLVVGRGRANAIGTAGSKLEGKEIPLLLQEAVKVEWN